MTVLRAIEAQHSLVPDHEPGYLCQLRLVDFLLLAEGGLVSLLAAVVTDRRLLDWSKAARSGEDSVVKDWICEVFTVGEVGQFFETGLVVKDDTFNVLHVAIVSLGAEPSQVVWAWIQAPPAC